MKVTSETALCRKDTPLPEAIRKLRAVGDLRAINSDPDRWVALVVPSSRQPPPSQDAAAASAEADAPQAARSGPETPAPIEACAGAPPEGPQTDFRQAYLVRVNLAGHFVWPGVSVEASTKLADTWSAEPTTLDIALPEAAKK